MHTYHIVGFYSKDFNLTIGSVATLKSVTIFIRDYIRIDDLCTIDLVSSSGNLCICAYYTMLITN